MTSANQASSGKPGKIKILIFIIVGLLLIGGAVVAANQFLRQRSSPKSTENSQSSANTSGVIFTSPDKTISARFPALPTEASVPSTIPGTSIQATKVGAWNYRIGRLVTYGLLEMHVPEKQTVTINTIANGAAARGQIVSTKTKTISGVEANEVKIKFTQDTITLNTTIVVAIKNDTVYIASYADANDSDQTASDFINSISIK